MKEQSDERISSNEIKVESKYGLKKRNSLPLLLKKENEIDQDSSSSLNDDTVNNELAMKMQFSFLQSTAMQLANLASLNYSNYCPPIFSDQ